MDTYAPRPISAVRLLRRSPLERAAVQKQTLQRAVTQSRKEGEGREDKQLRPTLLQVGVVSAASGSAYVEREGTKLIAAIYGPRVNARSAALLSSRGSFVVDVRYAPFSGSARKAPTSRGGGGQPDAKERELANTVREAISGSIQLEAYPKAEIQAFVQILQDEGSVAASCVTCVSLALADAGILMYDLTTACTALCLGGRSFVDPSVSEERLVQTALTALPSDEETQVQKRPNTSTVDTKQNDNSSSSASSSNLSPHASSTSPTDSDTDMTPSLTHSNGTLFLAYMPNLKQISAITHTGTNTPNEIEQLSELCLGGCEQMHRLMQECIIEAATKKSKTVQTTNHTQRVTAS